MKIEELFNLINEKDFDRNLLLYKGEIGIDSKLRYRTLIRYATFEYLKSLEVGSEPEYLHFLVHHYLPENELMNLLGISITNCYGETYDRTPHWHSLVKFPVSLFKEDKKDVLARVRTKED